MKPAWDKLMKKFADHKSALVADVDCTAEESKPLCETHGVQGFPSIKWGDPSAMELTPENWAEATAGKTVFIKFQAPW